MMDFRDSIAALVIRIVQLKFLMTATKMKLVQEVPTLIITTPASEPFKR